MADKIKLTVAVLLVLTGIGGFYQLSSSAAVVRLLCVLGGILAGGAVAWFTAPGQRFLMFSREAVTETKKVVWPTRKESFQTAAAVFAFIVVMAVFLWISDKSLEYILYDVVLGWKKS
ncbi:MAG: preprotein translocase subunit SecE [Acidobacteria bacterium RIFCSPLOWO2_02_FULL_59_13]|nr:MAG: preprotein translocase subunit SecE [Acidobacteria bacterium RIFCSPLOWO2_02_FULL_59_13]